MVCKILEYDVAAFLITQGFKLERIDREHETSVFVFEPGALVGNVEYLAKNAPAPAKRFYEMVQTVSAMAEADIKNGEELAAKIAAQQP